MTNLIGFYEISKNEDCFKANSHNYSLQYSQYIILENVTLGIDCISTALIVLLLACIRTIKFNDSDKVMPALETWCMFLFLHACLMTSNLRRHENKYWELNIYLLLKEMQNMIIADRVLIILSSLCLLMGEVRFFLGLQNNSINTCLTEYTMMVLTASLILTFFIVFLTIKHVDGFITCYNNYTIFYVVPQNVNSIMPILFSLFTSIIPIVLGMIILLILLSQSYEKHIYSSKNKGHNRRKNNRDYSENSSINQEEDVIENYQVIFERHEDEQQVEDLADSSKNKNTETFDTLQFQMKNNMNSSKKCKSSDWIKTRLLFQSEHSEDLAFCKVLLINWCAYALFVLLDNLMKYNIPVVEFILSLVFTCHYIPSLVIFPGIKEKIMLVFSFFHRRKENRDQDDDILRL